MERAASPSPPTSRSTATGSRPSARRCRRGREEIDAAGKIVTPGFVDIHTHYDGQATWDPEMAPSSWHGVTTVVMGNCGVGFAPAAPDRHQWLIGLMEGVEDIPGTALAEGLTWEWESFPEYLDALEKLPRTVDVATHVPHGAVRAYVMGDRGARNEPPTETDIARMAAIVEEGLRAGALGFSTSRTILHRSIDGELVPGTTATKEELIGIGRAMGRVGYGVFELVSDLEREWNEFEWMGELSRETGLPITFAALQSIAKEVTLDDQIAAMERENAKGAKIVAQIALRGNGVVMAWRGTVHPFMWKPAWTEIAGLPWNAQLAQLRDPSFRAPHARRGVGVSRVRLEALPPDRRRRLVHAVRDGPRVQLRADPGRDDHGAVGREGRERRRARVRPPDGGRRPRVHLFPDPELPGRESRFPRGAAGPRRLRQLALRRRRPLRHDLRRGVADVHAGALGARPEAAARSRSRARSSGSAGIRPCSTACTIAACSRPGISPT